MRALIPLLALTACASREMALLDGNTAPGDSAVAPIVERTVDLRIDLIPASLLNSAQSLLQNAVGVESPLDVGDVTLLKSVVQGGFVEAFHINPFIASVPGETLPLAGNVQLRRRETIQWYSTQTDTEGEFDARVVPATYRLTVIPNDPLLPMFTGSWTVADPAEPIILDLEAGVPIYGRVLSTTGAVVGARVHVEDEFGARSVAAVTDELGLYQVRVAPGRWTVVSEGRDDGRDPTLRFPSLTVGETGLNLDVQYPTALLPAYIEGQVEDAAGNPLIQARVRIVADSLDGYEEDATWETELFTGGSGGFISRAIPGRYTVEVTPWGDAPLTPVRLTDVRVDDGQTELPPIQLPAFRALTGSVQGANGAGLSSARVDCSEVGFDGRSWQVFTDERGEFQLEVADVTLACQADPPGNRDDLARQWRTVESGGVPVDFTLPVGERATGRVLVDGKSEKFVVVDVLDQTGRSLGSGLTLEDGEFSIPVDLQSAQ